MMLEKFTSRQLQVFVTVADSLNFTAAAKQLRIAQSAVSVTVRDMESAVGATLLNRDTRNVSLTPTGSTMRRLAQQLLEAQQLADRQLRGYLAGDDGELLVSALPSIAAIVLPPIVKKFTADNPNVLLQLRDGVNQLIVEDVRHGRTDLGVVMLTEDLSDLTVVPLALAPLVAVLPSDHPLAAHERVIWGELSKLPFVRNRSGGLHALIDNALAPSGAKLITFVEASSITSIASLVAAGLGVSALPQHAAPLVSFCAAVTRPLVEPVILQPIGIVFRKGGEPTPPAAKFIAELVAGSADLSHNGSA